MLNTLLKDTSVTAIVAGFIAVLVGFSSAMAIVLQAAQAYGADLAILQSWVWSLGIGMGICCFGLSAYYKKPIIIAWSTPGAALLASSYQGGSMAEAVGVFVAVATLSLVVALTGAFNRISAFIPMPIAAALLAGVLIQFGLSIFTSLQADPILVLAMLIAFFVMKLISPRYAVIAVLIVGAAVLFFYEGLSLHAIEFAWASPVWTTPAFNLNLLIGVGLPLFIVTMSAQNLPGIAVLQTSGYADQAISPVLSSVNLVTLLLAPFGCFAMNLAAITAAICTGEEAHPNKDKRYIAGLSAGVFNILAGLGAVAVVGLFASFPKPFIAALAGIALLSTIANSLHSALSTASHRDAAIVTFLICASGVSFFGIAASFWGVVAGVILVRLQRS